MALLRRLSLLKKRRNTDLERDPVQDEDSAIVNGSDANTTEKLLGAYPSPNGLKQSPYANGKSIEKSLSRTKDFNTRRRSSGKLVTVTPPPKPAPDQSPVTRKDVDDAFSQFAHLVHASQRPIPNQSGDGQYLEKEEPSGFWSDIKSMGMKDLVAVRHILEDKASGKPQDDRKMHMEEVIQVSSTLHHPSEPDICLRVSACGSVA